MEQKNGTVAGTSYVLKREQDGTFIRIADNGKRCHIKTAKKADRYDGGPGLDEWLGRNPEYTPIPARQVRYGI